MSLKMDLRTNTKPHGRMALLASVLGTLLACVMLQPAHAEASHIDVDYHAEARKLVAAPDLLKQTRTRAEQGSAGAQVTMGTYYWAFRHRPDHLSKGVLWFQKAAKQGNPVAQANWGLALRRGWATNPDIEKGKKLLKQSAAQGYPLAYCYLAAPREGHLGPIDLDASRDARRKCHQLLLKRARQGHAVAQRRVADQFAQTDSTKALHWYQKAYAQGDSQAAYGIARLHASNPSAVEAGKAPVWLKRAAKAGIIDAQYQLGQRFEYGNGVAKSTSRALAWYQRAADHHQPLALLKVGMWALDGTGGAADPHKAFKALHLAAQMGVVDAMIPLGKLYRDGTGTDKDATRAERWFTQAQWSYRQQAGTTDKFAKDKMAWAQAHLASLYAQGIGVPQNWVKARAWAHKPATMGNASAQRLLAKIYQQGLGVDADADKAQDWSTRAKRVADDFREAASQGDVTAQYRLGMMLINGRGAAQDWISGYDWLHQAAENGQANAQYMVGWCLQHLACHAGALEDYVPWYQKAAAQDEFRAMTELALLYANGIGVDEDKDRDRGMDLWRQAATMGSARAMEYLGIHFDNGWGVPKNADKAIQWYRKAATLGDAAAMYDLSDLYDAREGKGDAKRATTWALRALRQGGLSNRDRNSILEDMGHRYVRGKGVDKNYKTALSWFRRGAEAGDDDCQLTVGEMLSVDKVVPHDYPAAWKWYFISKDRGNRFGDDLREHLQSVATPEQRRQGRKMADQWLRIHPSDKTR